MAKRNRNSKSSQPNAPDLQQMLYQPQPPHNPYYPDPTLPPPPPYTELTSPLAPGAASRSHNPTAQHSLCHQQSYIGQMSSNNNANSHHPSYPRETSVVIQAPTTQVSVAYDRRAEKYHQRIRSFNNQALLIAIFAIVLSIWSFNMYKDRACLFNFTVHKPSKDVHITIGYVRDMHLNVAYLSAFVLLLCLAKSASGRSKSYSCYLFLIGFTSFLVTLYSGYLAYLAFYSPCTLNAKELVTNAGKSFLSTITDSLPAPDKGYFGESNVITDVNEDRQGLLIFVFDMINFISYFAMFLTATLLC